MPSHSLRLRPRLFTGFLCDPFPILAQATITSMALCSLFVAVDLMMGAVLRIGACKNILSVGLFVFLLRILVFCFRLPLFIINPLIRLIAGVGRGSSTNELRRIITFFYVVGGLGPSSHGVLVHLTSAVSMCWYSGRFII